VFGEGEREREREREKQNKTWVFDLRGNENMAGAVVFCTWIQLPVCG
jgi:hypothetical protein